MSVLLCDPEVEQAHHGIHSCDRCKKDFPGPSGGHALAHHTCWRGIDATTAEHKAVIARSLERESRACRRCNIVLDEEESFPVHECQG